LLRLFGGYQLDSSASNLSQSFCFDHPAWLIRSKSQHESAEQSQLQQSAMYHSC
jgi:hypothetical protein